jgi:hypothetical protein
MITALVVRRRRGGYFNDEQSAHALRRSSVQDQR